MRKQIVVLAAVLLSGCMQGYWPKVEGPMDARYEATVRECQTDTQVGLASGAPQGGLGFALDIALVGERQGSPAAIDACMAKYGYKVKTSG